MRLPGKIAIITGAGRGIGRAIAKKFAAEGASVLLTARTDSELKDSLHEIQSSGGKAITLVADVSQPKACELIFRAARDTFGPVDILVNNAGIYGHVLPLEEVTVEEWDEVMAVNLRGPFLLSKLVLPEMYERHSGSIVNITSIAGKAAFGLNGPYATSKAGLAGLTRTLAGEAARKGVRVNAISPGPVTSTKMSQDLGRGLVERFKTTPDVLMTKMLDGVLQGRPQTEEEIADAALFLASDESSAITGQTLNVDGGMAFY